MRVIGVILIVILSSHSFSQIVQSSCTVHDSILEHYKTDAERLTLERIFDQNSPYIDSVIIPNTYSDTILNALIAIYNATGIPERDTVINMLDIHTREITSMSSFYLSADSNLVWMQNLKNGNLNTGQPIIDEIITNYGFTIYSYSSYPFNSYATVRFVASNNYNLRPITNSIETIPSVYWASTNSYAGDGATIYDSIYPTHVELTFRYAWGDCPAGCTVQRLWKFNVYYDCSVEFVESSGSILSPTASLQENIIQDLSIFPNPFSNSFSIKGGGRGLFIHY